jgi:hypothetical protein
LSAPLVVVAEEGDLELAGVPAGEADWIWCGPPASATAPVERAELVVGLGAAALPPRGTDDLVRWLDGPGSDPPAPGRLIAQGGHGLWRRAPWPVADDLFDAPRASPSAPVLVTGPDDEVGKAAEVIEAHGPTVTTAPRLTRPALEAAVAVVVLRSRGAPPPAWLMAPLAARRVLVCVGHGADFGLQAGIDHLAVPDLGHAAALTAALAARPKAFDSLRAFGVIAALHHRASSAYARLLTDVRLERAAASATA